jgi:peptidase S41-like protein
MSEKIYSFLLRLYPAHFRRQYEAEALQLLQDRMRDERGFLRKLQLWIDLLTDFALGLPLACRNAYTKTQTWQAVTGLPSFRILEKEPLRPFSVMMGSLIGVATLALFIFAMNHAATFHLFSGSIGRLDAAAAGSEGNSDVRAVAEKLEKQIRSANQLQSCFFEKLELHPGNIGYVKLSWFANPTSCGAVAEGVMQRLNETDAIIFDLRDTRGGYPEMVRLMAGWLFDRPVGWYNPRAASPDQLVTDSPVPGSRLANKPVFVLTSSRTFSGAEHFAYNLKALKRATIVGETTSGASHGGTRTSPSQTSVSEPTPRWEGHGVEPDVRVNPADALRTAENLARSAMRKK